MMKSKFEISLSSAAIIAGISLLIMVVAAPFAELYVFPKLIVSDNWEETTKNMIANDSLFRIGTLGYLITFICDLLVTWALYILLKPVSMSLSLLTAWCRLVYTVIALIAFTNLVTILKLLNNPENISALEPEKLYSQVQFSITAFKNGWYFGILFFALHLGLLGFLVFKANYIPKLLGVLLIISGLGYLANGVKPFLFPNVNIDFAVYTFYGELIFMLWLLIRGYRIKELNP
ncbi:MAG: DUF4386 domain-containing protein [Chitinophagales bacterium]